MSWFNRIKEGITTSTSEKKEIAAMQVAATAAAAKDKLARQQELEGLRIGADIAKSKAMMNRPKPPGRS